VCGRDHSLTVACTTPITGTPLANPRRGRSAHARPHQRRRLAPGDGRGSYRYFVSESGEQRSYWFTVDDSRDVTVEVLDAQLRRAEFPARGRFDGAKRYTP
jgi:hypothetical protein